MTTSQNDLCPSFTKNECMYESTKSKQLFKNCNFESAASKSSPNKSMLPASLSKGFPQISFQNIQVDSISKDI